MLHYKINSKARTYKLKLRLLITTFLVMIYLFLNNLWADTYYIDYIGGSDSNDGRSEYSPWKHCPGDNNAVGIPANTVFIPGDVIYFKKGVIYDGQISLKDSGMQLCEGRAAIVRQDGLFTDLNQRFKTIGVLPGDYIYIFVLFQNKM